MTPREPDDRALADMANEQLSRREVRWICPYCGNEVPDEHTPHCGEVHARPMTNEEYDEECAAQDEQSLDYFNHYIAGDR